MLYLMSGQQERALQAIPGLDPADQEFWQQTFWGLTNYFDSASIPCGGFFPPGDKKPGSLHPPTKRPRH